MNSAIFFNHITPNELNKKILKSFEDYSKKHDDIVMISKTKYFDVTL